MDTVQSAITHERRLTVDGVRVRYVESGAGDVLLYLHGVGDAGGILPGIAAFADVHRIVRPDHPGFLASDDAALGTPRELAQWYVGFLDALDIDEFVLVGCSFGGWVAAELALLVPERVRSLTLIDPAGLAGDGTALNVFEAAPEQIRDATFATERFRAAPPPDPATAALLQRGRAEARRLASDPYMHDESLGGRLSKLRMPTQLVWGALDGIMPVGYAQAWLASIPGATLSVIQDAGHLPQLEQPAEFISAATLLA